MALTLVPMTLHKANAFVARHHRHSKPTRGCRFALGALCEGELVGVAVVGRPISRLLDSRVTAEVTRVCTSPDAPKGTGSFLYSRAWRAWQAMGGLRLVTYTLASESGATLRGAGWRMLGTTKAEPSWARPSRPDRDVQPLVDGQMKFRWHAECREMEDV